jgi:hypothetical protein
MRVFRKEERARQDKGSAWKQGEAAKAGDAEVGGPDPVRIMR